MKRQGWIGFFIGIVFCLLMVLPTSVQASLFISGDYDGYGTVLLNYENSPGGSGNFWDYTLNKDAYIAANTYLDGLAVNSNGWRIFNDGGEIYNNSYSGLIIGYPYSLMSGSLYNNSGYIEGTNGVKMGAGTVTNSGGIYGHDGYGIYQYSEGASPFTVSNGVYVPLSVIIDPDTYQMTITPGTPETTGIGWIEGYYGGIYSYIGGAGSATVENAGVIMGYGGAGIGLYGNGTSTATVTNTGTIYGGYGGYYYAGVDIDGVLTATVTNSGMIDGDSEGVRIANTNSATVTNNAGATISGYEGVDFYEVRNVTVDNYGSIRGRYGIDVNHADTVDITNNAGGTIRGQYGINIDDADTVNITNAGSIRGQYGIYIDDSGDVTITNNSGGTIRGQYGVYVENTDSAEVINNAGGTISGEYGVYMQYIGSADTAKVDNYGDIHGRYGISISNSLAAEVNNESTGNIEGRSYGVGIASVESAEVTNSGIISQQDDDDDNFAVGIYNADTAKVTNNAGGTITSYNGRGIDMEYIGGTQTAEVVNSGTIQAWQEGVYIYESETAKVTNNEGGLIQSYSDYGVGMVNIYDSADVNNSGTIQAYKSGVGILGVYGPVTVTNNSTGVIQGGYGGYGGLDDDDMFPVSGVGILGIGSADVVNEGTIEGIFAGVAAYGAFGSDDDDDVPGTLSVTNSGIINGEYLGVGLGYADEATVINEENGMITGGGKGVSIFNVGIASVINEGTIIGYGTMGDFVYGLYGVYSSGGEGANGYGIFITNPDDTMETATVANNGGVISGMGGNGDGTVYDDDDDDCYFYGCDGYGGEGYGVYVTNVKAVTVDNTGEINGTGGDGIGGDSGYGGYGSYGGYGFGGEGYGVLITDDWMIPTIQGIALYIEDDDDATSMETATVTNSGVISGIGGNGVGGDGYFGGIGFGADGYGVYIANAQTVTIDNSGTIDGIGGDGYGGMGEVGYGGYGGYGYGGSGYGVYIANAETAAVNNIGGTISGRSGSSDFNIDNYYDDDDDFAPLSIFDDDDDSSAGIFMEWIPDVTVNNTGGTITGTHESVGFSAYSDAYGIYINSPWDSYTDTAEINNSGMVSGTASSYGYGGYSYAIANGAYIDDADTVTINNLSDGTITATAFAQSNFFEGQISAQGGFETEAEAAGLFIEEAYESATVTNYGTISAEATALDDTGYGGAFAGGGGVIIAYTAEATVDNIGGTISGTATADGSFAQAGGVGVGIGNYESEAGDSATVNNTGTISGTATASGHYDDGEARSSGVMVGNFITVDVLNGAYMDEEENLVITGGTISGTATGNGYGYSGDSGYGYGYGVYIEYAETATVTNYGTISGTGTGYGYNEDIQGGYGYGEGYGIYMSDIIAERTATVTNIGGTISGKGIGVSEGGGYADGYGYGVYMSNVGAAVITNGAMEEEVITGGTISGEGVAYNDGYGKGYGIYIYNAGTVDITNYGEITGTGSGNLECPGCYYSYGIYIDKPGSYSTEDAVQIYNRGTISGKVGIYSDGYTTIENYGTITSTDVDGNYYAIELDDGYNNVLLGTGSVINGVIIADYDDLDFTNNYIYLEAEDAADVNTMAANQILGFDSMTKTGAGTWVLTGDMDYTDTNYNETGSMPITVTEGVLAFGARETTAGATVSSLYVDEGASIGYVITPEGDTGALTVTGDADFNDGTVIVIPTPTDANLYDLTTTYENVLTVGGTIYNPWTDVTANLAFLTPYMVADNDGAAGVYDLILQRLSFTTGADPSSIPLGELLDELYGSTDDPDLLALLNALLTEVSESEAQRALAELGGGSHTAFQLMSFSGLDKYLGILNNHMGGMGGFAGYNSGIGFALNEKGTQLAMAGSGETISDVAPIMLAAVGNVISQGQAAKGTNWGLWADGYLGTGNRRSNELIAKYKQNLFGGIIGFDYRIADDLFIGIAGGISRTNVEFDDLLDKGHMDSYHGSLYLNYNGKPWYAAGVFTYAYNKYNLDRYITTLGPTQVASSDYSGNEYTGYAEVGYKIDAGNVEIRPLAAFQVDYLEQEAFAETGAGIYNLNVDKGDTGSYKSFLGVNVTGTIKLSESAAFKPEFRLKWAHEFSNDDHMINARFDGMGSSSFVVAAEKLSRDTAIIGLGMNLLFNKHVSAYIQYDAELNSDYVNHTGLAGLRLAW